MRARTRGLALTASASAALAAILVVACTTQPGAGGGGGGGGGGGEPGPIGIKDMDFARTPPGVERATVQALERAQPEGNALLEVTFEKGDTRVRDGVTIFPHGKKVALRDDGSGGDAKAGDGVHSAIVAFDFEEVSEQAAAASRRGEKIKPRPIFRGREIVGIEDPKMVRERVKRFSEFKDIARLVRERVRLDLFDLIPTVDPADVDPPRSLVVVDPSVVRDPARTVDPCTGAGNPNGVWTFKHLVTEMVAGTGVDPADFVEQWLKLWDSNQTVTSGFIAAPRPGMMARIVNPWPRTAAGKLDLDKSPFRLSAIVNRIDLGNNTFYGGGDAGEGRFVFGVWDRQAAGCTFMPFGVIFEYGVPKSGCHQIRAWANQWVALSSLALGSPAYNAALESITETFAKAGAAPSKPNGSALNQLRTNENALDPLWELREFRLDPASHLFFEDTTKQSADETLNNTATLAAYVNANAPALITDTHVVPDHFPGPANPFMAATSRASAAQLGTHFRAAGILDNNARFHFSLNTCTACHIRETSTNGAPAGNTAFLHVDPRPMPARLSKFMTGSTATITDTPDLFNVSDPVVPATIHSFNDLDRRRIRLAAIAGSSCFRIILVPPFRLFERIPRIPPGDPPPFVTDPRFDSVNVPLRMTH